VKNGSFENMVLEKMATHPVPLGTLACEYEGHTLSIRIGHGNELFRLEAGNQVVFISDAEGPTREFGSSVRQGEC
jgi:hypothetical protein